MGEYLKLGQHIDLVGAYKKDMREANDGVISKSSVFVDTFDGLQESGDIAIPLVNGILSKETIQGNLFSLCKRKSKGRAREDEITVFKSVVMLWKTWSQHTIISRNSTMSSTYRNMLRRTDFNPPADWLQIKTIGMHTGGESLRVIVSGFPELKGNSVLEYRRYCKENFDALRTALMFEPRGHADMYGCILVPPNDDDGDFGILFLHNEGYSTMCGHAIIAIATLAVEMKWIAVVEGGNILKIYV